MTGAGVGGLVENEDRGGVVGWLNKYLILLG